MPVELTRTQIAAIATLARLELDDSEIDHLGRQLAGVVDWARQVQQIDTTGVPPTASVALEQDVERADQPTPSLDRRDALANAPDAASEAGLFKVPRVIG